MKQYVKINGVTFEVVKDIKEPYKYESIYEAYGRPSPIKVRIYNEWFDFFRHMDSWNFGVCSHNSQTFSLTCEFIHNEVMYRAWITPMHNRLSVIKPFHD